MQVEMRKEQFTLRCEYVFFIANYGKREIQVGLHKNINYPRKVNLGYIYCIIPLRTIQNESVFVPV